MDTERIMQAIKLVATDLDRTLLRSDKTISEYSKDVFWRLHNSGVKIAYITARTPRKVSQLISGLPCDAVAYNNGSHVYCDNKLISEWSIPGHVGQPMLTLLHNRLPDVKISATINQKQFYNFDNPRIDNINAFKTDFTDVPCCAIDRIIVESNDVAEVKKYAASNVNVCIADGASCVITCINAQKHIALSTIAHYFKIDMSDIISFGDDNNDIEMLRQSGVGVAVGNANSEVIQAADYITDSNDDDGVARYLSVLLNNSWE